MISDDELMFCLPNSEAVGRMFDWLVLRFWILNIDKGIREFIKKREGLDIV
jgi:hypothetical protein